MNSHPQSPCHRTTGILTVAFILIMGVAMIAASGLAAAPAGSVNPELRVAGDGLPGAPTNLTASVLSASEIGLSWTNPSGTLTDNNVYEWVAASCSGDANEAIDLGGVYVTYAFSDLTPSTTYSFEVAANNSEGQGPPSACVTATTSAPGTPTGLAASAISETEIGLSWTNPAGSLTDNNVYEWVAASCSGSAAEDVDLGGVYTSYAFSGLTPSTNYSFEVTATTSGVTGPPTGCVTAFTPPPAAPTGLTVTAVTAHKISLSWTNPWGALIANTVYEYSSGCSSLLNTFAIAVATTYTATGLAPLTTYCFTVSASITGGAGPQSASVSGTTLQAKPSAPTGLTAAVISYSQIDLSWTNPSGTLTDNTVYTSIGSSCGAGEAYPNNLGSVVTSFDATGLSPGTTYSWTVTASNSAGQSAGSNCAAATTPSGPPSPPSGLTATAVSGTEVELSWTNPSGTLTDNTVYTSIGSGCGAGEAYPNDLGSIVTSYDATGLTPGTTYSWTVTASSSAGQSAGSNCAAATTPSGPPSPPSALTATAVSGTEVELSWTNPSGTLTDNTVYTSIGSGCGAGEGYPNSLGAVVTSFDATGLTPSTTYSWTVTASNSAGQSAGSNCASATTLADPPLAPTGLTATAVSESEIDLNWTNPSGSLTLNTVYEYASDCSTLLATIVIAATTSFPAIGLAASTTYCFTVSATFNGNEGPQSLSASATTFPITLTIESPVATTVASALTPTSATVGAWVPIQASGDRL